ncbi:MAG TPA: Rrf2 family transcriptional regulator [Hyphomicrobiales bacterium]|nr:Rrf2 family transcriptional regulator [Hyphomicrobiales bacterium]
MRLTNHTDYAMRVLIFAAAAQQTVTISKISEAYGISKEHLRKVVHALAQHGYVTTTQGRSGGITLGRPADQINLRELVQRFETRQLVECFDPQTNTCAINGMCNLKHALQRAQESFFETLGQYTLRDIIDEPRLQVFVRQRTGS